MKQDLETRNTDGPSLNTPTATAVQIVHTKRHKKDKRSKSQESIK